MADSRVTRTQIVPVGGGPDSRVTRTQTIPVGGGADSRVTRVQVAAVGGGSDSRVTRAQALVVGGGPDSRLTRLQALVVGGGADSRITRLQLFAVIPVTLPGGNDEISVTDQVSASLIFAPVIAEAVAVTDDVLAELTVVPPPVPMPIQDLAGNPILTQSSPMLGFINPDEVPQDLSLRIYNFLIGIIRIEDQRKGDKFLERYFLGPEAVWQINTTAIRNLPVLWDVAQVPDQFLQYLKNIVGWTKELSSITDNLAPLTLRRLIGASVPFWKRRGPEDAIIDILRLTTAARLRLWNWFDFRVILGETGMGEEHDGRDPHMISLPGPPDTDERRYNIRIVDDGTLDRALVRDLAKLTRPANERVEISYIGFLDLFSVDDDDSQWAAEPDAFGGGGGVTTLAVATGSMVATAPATDPAEALVGLAGADDWTNYVVTWRAQGTDWVATFYRTDNTDMYRVIVKVTTNEVVLEKFVAGVPTTLATVDMLAVLGVELAGGVYYAIRVEATPESGSTRIKVHFDSEQIISELDGSHASGAVGMGHDTSGDIKLDEVELFFNPLTTDTIDINP